MSTGTSKSDDEDENARVARHILAALRAAGVEAHLVEDIDDAPPLTPDEGRAAGRVFGDPLRTCGPAPLKTDWLADARASALAWWIPQAAAFAALLAPVPARVGIWTVALAWMGAACILNYRRCGRTHCRYTGPYYLAMIVPVLALGIAPVLITLTEWFAIAVAILLGSKLIRWATERAWGKFSPPDRVHERGH